MAEHPEWKWWWCRDCQVKWQSSDPVCWSCEKNLDTDVRAKHSWPPAITSQNGF